MVHPTAFPLVVNLFLLHHRLLLLRRLFAFSPHLSVCSSSAIREILTGCSSSSAAGSAAASASPVTLGLDPSLPSPSSAPPLLPPLAGESDSSSSTAVPAASGLYSETMARRREADPGKGTSAFRTETEREMDRPRAAAGLGRTETTTSGSEMGAGGVAQIAPDSGCPIELGPGSRPSLDSGWLNWAWAGLGPGSGLVSVK